MSGPEVAKTPGGGAPGKEGKEPVANGHSGEANDVNPFAEYMWMENEEEYNRQVSSFSTLTVSWKPISSPKKAVVNSFFSSLLLFKYFNACLHGPS